MRRILLILTLAFGVGLAEKGPITIGSKIDTEGAVLAQLVRLVLEHHGFTVIDRSGFGTTNVVREALLAGEIDLYPEYTGNAPILLSDQIWPEGIATQADQIYGAVRVMDLNLNGIRWLARSPANNTWAIAVRQEFAEAHGLRTIADLARYVNEGGTIKLIGSQEFVDRPDALPAFEKTYGFSLRDDQLVIIAGGNTAQTLAATAQGTDGVNAGMSYGTDGALPALGLVALVDTEGAVAVYQPAITVRESVFARYPELAELLEPIFATLDEATLATLNGRVQVDGDNPADVARDYLRSLGVID